MINHTKCLGMKGGPFNPRVEGKASYFKERLPDFGDLSDEEQQIFKGFALPEEFVIAPLGDCVEHGLHPYLAPQEIIDRVARYYYLKPAQLVGHSRYRSVAYARMTAVYLIRVRFDKLSLCGIGTYFSNRDHSTIIHAVKVTRQRLKQDPEFRDQVKDLKKLLDEDETHTLVDV